MRTFDRGIARESIYFHIFLIFILQMCCFVCILRGLHYRILVDDVKTLLTYIKEGF